MYLFSQTGGIVQMFAGEREARLLVDDPTELNRRVSLYLMGFFQTRGGTAFIEKVVLAWRRTGNWIVTYEAKELYL